MESITHPDDLTELRRHMNLLMAGELSSYKTEKRCLHASGETVWMTLQATLLRHADGAPAHFLAQVLDITDRHRYEEMLQYMVDHDPLTDLLNRHSFERELTSHLARGRRYGLEGATVMVDLDCFKQINDSLGHRAGDELIVHVARTLRERLRETDVLARLSGDEFIVLLPKADRAGAREVARDLLSAFRAVEVPSPDGGSQSITASIGVAMIEGEHHVNCEDIMVAADLAMYAAKDRGRDRFAFYSPDVDYGQGYHLGRPEPAGERAESAVAVA